MEQIIEQFSRELSTALLEKRFVKISFGKPTQKDGEYKKVTGRLIQAKESTLLSLAFETTTQTFTRNFDCTLQHDTALLELTNLCGAQFKNINLFTTSGDFILMYSKKLIPRLQTKPATFKSPRIEFHNREKRRYLDLKNNVYLRELGITTQTGQIAPSRQNKFKQIDKFVEVIDTLIQTSALKKTTTPITIADMGSGKGYLTFALYDYIANSLKLPVVSTGIEYRQDLVDVCNSIAKSAAFSSLTFVPGTIESNPLKEIDLLIALHACDTATDDAIKQGIDAGATIIVTAPCCHKQIRKAMNVEGPLAEITKYGILKERQAEMITDTIRALLLEAHGYKTKVFEFIADAHTHKNVMITAIKRSGTPDPEPFLKKISDLKETFGISEHYLESILS
ncbi:MAG: SAM-dependent methyltransferase [Fibrobacterales bacterium]